MFVPIWVIGTSTFVAGIVVGVVLVLVWQATP